MIVDVFFFLLFFAGMAGLFALLCLLELIVNFAERVRSRAKGDRNELQQ